MAKKLYSPEETAKKFESRPQAIKDILYSFEITSAVAKVGEKNGLHIDQMELLNTETAQVMMGLTETKDFVGVLMEELSIDEAKASAVASDINELLFSKIRGAMNQPSAAATTVPSIARQPLSEVLPKGGVAASPSETPISLVKPSSNPIPAAPQVAPAVPVAPIAPLPVVQKADMHPADIALTQKTVAVPPPTPPLEATQALAKPIDASAVPPKPTDYKADPYREPVI